MSWHDLTEQSDGDADTLKQRWGSVSIGQIVDVHKSE